MIDSLKQKVDYLESRLEKVGYKDTKISPECVVPYSGKLSRKKTLANFTVLWLFAKVFLCENWGHDVLWRSKSEQSAQVFYAKIIFFTNLHKFSPSKVFRYTAAL